MLGFVYALVTVLAWGTWLAPSQNIVFKNQQIKTFYVAAANLALAALVFLAQGFSGLTWACLLAALCGRADLVGQRVPGLHRHPPAWAWRAPRASGRRSTWG